MRSLEALDAADFAALRGHRCRIAPDDAAPFDAELVEVAEIARGRAAARRSRSCSKVAEPTARLRIHRVEHERLGAVEIFLVPISADSYEAVWAVSM